MGEVSPYGCCGENINVIMNVQVEGEEGWMDRAFASAVDPPPSPTQRSTGVPRS